MVHTKVEHHGHSVHHIAFYVEEGCSLSEKDKSIGKDK